MTNRLGEWVCSRIPDSSKLISVSDHPWAKTYRSEANGVVYFSKILPTSQRGAMQAMRILGEQFVDHVPNVIDMDAAHGFILFRSHGGTDIGANASLGCKVAMLVTYAEIQAKSAGLVEILDSLPQLDWDELVRNFVHYFDPKSEPETGVNASHFLGKSESYYFYRQLLTRQHLFESIVPLAKALPRTINHGDLRSQNAAERSDGELVIFDWDEAIAGPAGMSLHSMFGGCSVLVDLVCDDSQVLPIKDNSYSVLIERYVDTLVQGGYSTSKEIRCGVAGSAFIGLMRFLQSYGKFPSDDADMRKVVSRIIQRRTEDILKLGDRLSLLDRSQTFTFVDGYEKNKRDSEACRLMSDFVLLNTQDVEAHALLADYLQENGKADEAEAVLRRGLSTTPGSAELRLMLGTMMLSRLELEGAIDHLQAAVHFDPTNSEAIRELKNGHMMQAAIHDAKQPGNVPTIRFADEELQSGLITKSKQRLAARLFREYGTLVLEGVYSPELLANLHAEFLNRHQEHLGIDSPKDSLKVGDKRFMITVDVTGGINVPHLYAPKMLSPILTRLLGESFILGSLTAVASMPGARDMRMHKDHPALFPGEDDSNSLPTFAITTLIPTLGFDPLMGTTRVVKGSHRKSSDDSAEMDSQDPYAPIGSCLLMDYRLSHQGLANRSSNVRPVLSLVYSRPWFRDSVNYSKQDPLVIDEEDLQAVCDDWKHLFSWSKPKSLVSR